MKTMQQVRLHIESIMSVKSYFPFSKIFNLKSVIGVEIKNMLTPIPKSEIITKLEMCKTLGIYPIFACRWQEIHRDLIQQNDGFLWQFKKQIYPFGQENLVEELQKRFNFPVEIKGELPSKSIISFQTWIKKIKKTHTI